MTVHSSCCSTVETFPNDENDFLLQSDLILSRPIWLDENAAVHIIGPISLTTVFLTFSQLLKELVDLEDKEAYFPV